MIDIIDAYTRQQAIADGMLVDVTATARECGLRYPVAFTSAVWGEYVTVPKAVAYQDEMGRLWDILNMLRYTIKCSPEKSELRFTVLVQNDDSGPQPVMLKSVIGPGDEGEPVLTVLLPDED